MKIDGELDFTKIPIPPTTQREREREAIFPRSTNIAGARATSLQFKFNIDGPATSFSFSVEI
jgi:hypothetical protein